MKKIIRALGVFSFFIVLSLTTISSLGGPGIVGGGAGESEFSIVFARANLPSFLATCKNFDCQLTVEEQNLLAQLLVLAKNPPEAVFKTSAQVSGKLFRVHRRAHEVWFNQDNLWLDAKKTKGYTVPDAVSLWIEVLAVDLKYSRPALNEIEQKTRNVLIQKFETYYDELGATVWKQSDADRLYLFDSYGQALDVNSSLSKAFNCGGSTKLALKVFSGSWQLLSSSPTERKYVLRLRVIWSCNSTTPSRGEVLMMGTAQVLPKRQLKIIPDSLSFILGQ